MENASKLASVIDGFEQEHGEIPEDRSQLLKKAKYHERAFREFTERFEKESDPDEQDYLRSIIQFHQRRLRALLG
jgi:DNA-binding ferritin-like protein